MSTIKVDNIRIVSESVSRPVTGVAAVWVNFDGTTATAPSDMAGVRDSLNISGIVDNQKGNYTANYINNMASNGYSPSCWANANKFSDAFATGGNIPTTSSTTLRVNNSAFDATDSDVVCLSIHGDLA